MIIRDVLITKKASSRIPIWFMRQAGRYLPEYREIRSQFDNFIRFCLTPDAAKEVTIQPLKRFDIDAAIIFSDILIVPYALGNKVEFLENYGPRLDQVKSQKDLEKLREINLDVFTKVARAISLTKEEMTKNYPGKTLIGFAGAPWTVCAYMIQGGGSKDFAEAVKFAYREEKVFSALIEIITDATIEYLNYQIKAGVDVVKIFDSWAGMLPEGLFERYCIKPVSRIVSEIKAKHPEIGIIGFPKGANTMLKEYETKTKVDCVAVDQRIAFRNARKSIDVALQGNFDNILLASGDSRQIETEAKKMFQYIDDKPYIFNLGHGMLPETPIANVEKLIYYIRTYESNRA